MSNKSLEQELMDTLVETLNGNGDDKLDLAMKAIEGMQDNQPEQQSEETPKQVSNNEPATSSNDNLSKDDIIKLVNQIVSARFKREDSVYAKKASSIAKPVVEASSKTDVPTDAMAEIQKLRRELAERDQKLQEQTRKAREKDAYDAVIKTLKTKVTPGTEDIVAKLLFHADKKIVIEDDGQVFYEADGNIYDLEAGIEHYLSNDQFKMFKPAPKPKKNVITKQNKPNLTPAPVKSGIAKPSLELAMSELSRLGLDL